MLRRLAAELTDAIFCEHPSAFGGSVLRFELYWFEVVALLEVFIHVAENDRGATEHTFPAAAWRAVAHHGITMAITRTSMHASHRTSFQWEVFLPLYKHVFTKKKSRNNDLLEVFLWSIVAKDTFIWRRNCPERRSCPVSIMSNSSAIVTLSALG